tara:strand:- start:384 stop:494 length:111 start_codon:yes stop_codon:yes gene_type:complete
MKDELKPVNEELEDDELKLLDSIEKAKNGDEGEDGI